MNDEREAEAVQRAMLEEVELDLLIRELWRRGFVVIPWGMEISFEPDGEAMTA